MSRTEHETAAQIGGFPRVSGDEPDAGKARTQGTTFSPRERG